MNDYTLSVKWCGYIRGITPIRVEAESLEQAEEKARLLAINKFKKNDLYADINGKDIDITDIS